MLPFLTSSSPRRSCDRGIGAVRLGPRELGLALLDDRLVRILLDHEQEIAGGDIRALLEQPLLEEPGHPGAQLDHVDRDDPAIELIARGNRGGLHSDDGHRGRRRRGRRAGRRLGGVVAGRERQRQQQGHARPRQPPGRCEG